MQCLLPIDARFAIQIHSPQVLQLINDEILCCIPKMLSLTMCCSLRRVKISLSLLNYESGVFRLWRLLTFFSNMERFFARMFCRLLIGHRFQGFEEPKNTNVRMGASRGHEPFGVDGPKCTTLMTPWRSTMLIEHESYNIYKLRVFSAWIIQHAGGPQNDSFVREKQHTQSKLLSWTLIRFKTLIRF